MLVVNVTDALSEGRCQIGYRKCGSSKRCIGANDPCVTDSTPCPPGRTLCGDECAPDHYITDGYKKECGGKCVLGREVCKDGGPECQADKRTKCGDSCILNKYYKAYGYKDCEGECISGSQMCCSNEVDQSTADCCGEGYYACGKECRLKLVYQIQSIDR